MRLPREKGWAWPASRTGSAGKATRGRRWRKTLALLWEAPKNDQLNKAVGALGEKLRWPAENWAGHRMLARASEQMGDTEADRHEAKTCIRWGITPGRPTEGRMSAYQRHCWDFPTTAVRGKIRDTWPPG